MSKPSTNDLAQRTMDIIPLVMRVMSAEMRASEHTPAASHVPLLGTLQYRSYTLSELAEAHSVSAPTMSSTISTLEERGWVQRERSTEDRRIVWVSITPEGRRVLDNIQHHVIKRIAALLEHLSDEDKERLIEGLTVLRDSFAAAIEQDPDLRRI